jgi:hypothetical protein
MGIHRKDYDVTTKTAKMDSYIDHEGPVAGRYKWWGVYLVREKRRLQAIANAIAESKQAIANRMPLAESSGRDSHPIPPVQFSEDVETPDELLTRVDAEVEMADALVELEAGGSEQEESKTHGDSVRDKETIPDDVTRRKLSGRAALLGKKRTETSEDF